MSVELREAKRVVVSLIQTMSRRRSVDVLWWEPADDVLTLYVEGHVVGGGMSRTSHTFTRESLERLSSEQARGELRGRVLEILAGFGPRT